MVADWPALPFTEWADTQTTLHRWIQCIGKTRLAFSPRQNHWWHSALYLTSRGLTTSPMPSGPATFEVELDFIDHQLRVRTSAGAGAAMRLVPMSVADFYRRYLELLRQAGITVRLRPVPMELSDVLPLDQDATHASYDAAAVRRCWEILVRADTVLKRWRGWFLGKSSPSHFWWGAFDLACTRFSGRPAPRHPGGVPNCPDFVTREAYSHECASVGWWPGTAGILEEPAFYAYAYPEPDGYRDARIAPTDAYYHKTFREWILPYEAVRSAENPERLLMSFSESTYRAAADLAGWDRAALERHREEQ